jgi:uncharacterized membrane protein YfcA
MRRITLMTEPLTPIKLLAACAVLTMGCALQGSVGFGFALVAAPILVLINPSLVPGPLLFCGLVLTVLMSYRERQAMDVSGLKWGILGRLPGTFVALVVLTNVPQKEMTLTLGALVLFAVALSVSGLHISPTTWTLLSAGALSGFMGTTASIGGPPIALLYQNAPGARLRSTLSGYFALGTTISLLALSAVGRFGRHEFWSALALLPGVLIGFILSARTRQLFDRGYTRAAVLTISAVSGAVVILRGLL